MYTASVNDYIVEGGDGYESFVGTTKLVDERAGPLLAEVLTNYIRDNGPVNPAVEGRITFK
jgi:2',3'-cyclic-nucleotide 2'-phosphodiesterase (5'-nucleotidase family)